MSKFIVTMVAMVALVATVSVASAQEYFEPSFDKLSYTDAWGRPMIVEQVSERAGYSSGDENAIVIMRSDSFEGGRKYGYLFIGTTVIVSISGYGLGSEAPGTVRVSSIDINYDRDTTKFLSFSWSDVKETYFIAFTENGRPYAGWLDLNSPVFREVLRMEKTRGGEELATIRVNMGSGITRVINETTRIEFRPENRK